MTTPQIVLFGLTGGLLPCPAALTVLLVCLQVKKITLGFMLVAGFSFGLALTMVTAGVVAAWSVRQANQRFAGLARRCGGRRIFPACCCWCSPPGWPGTGGTPLPR